MATETARLADAADAASALTELGCTDAFTRSHGEIPFLVTVQGWGERAPHNTRTTGRQDWLVYASTPHELALTVLGGARMTLARGLATDQSRTTVVSIRVHAGESEGDDTCHWCPDEPALCVGGGCDNE